jgi:phage anti-repressor protein
MTRDKLLLRRLNMFELEIITKKGEQLIDSKLLHKALEVRSYHADWIRRRIENYQFEKGKDYHSILSNRSDGKAGKKRRDYLLTIDMAKELCMIENNDIGKKARRYFINAEKQLRKHEIVRIATKEARKTLTDSVRESGENVRMHGHGYSNYTNLAYDLAGIKEEYKTFKAAKHPHPFRDALSNSQLRRLEGIELLIRSMVDADKQYSEIKESLKPLFEKKEIKNA